MGREPGGPGNTKLQGLRTANVGEQYLNQDKRVRACALASEFQRSLSRALPLRRSGRRDTYALRENGDV